MSKEVEAQQATTAFKTKTIKKIRIMKNYIGKGVVLIQAREDLLKEMFGKNIFNNPPEQQKRGRVDMTGKEKNK